MTNKHDEELVERVKKAITEQYPKFHGNEAVKCVAVGFEHYSEIDVYAQSALTAINLPAIRAQARKEALEEAAQVCDDISIAWRVIEGAGHLPQPAVANDCAVEIRKLIEKEG